MLAREDYRDACLQLRRQQQPAQSVHLAWAAWQKYLHFKSLQRHSKQLCRRDRRHKVDDLVQQLQQAARDKNLSLQWKLAYQIAGGKHGRKSGAMTIRNVIAPQHKSGSMNCHLQGRRAAVLQHGSTKLLLMQFSICIRKGQTAS